MAGRSEEAAPAWDVVVRTLGLVPGPEFEPPDRVGIEQFARAGADMIRLWPPWIFVPELCREVLSAAP